MEVNKAAPKRRQMTCYVQNRTIHVWVAQIQLVTMFFCLPGLAFYGIHRCLLVESKDGRHHYAAHSSIAKIRASRQADSSERNTKAQNTPLK